MKTTNSPIELKSKILECGCKYVRDGYKRYAFIKENCKEHNHYLLIPFNNDNDINYFKSVNK